MINFLTETEHLAVPDWVVDLESIRRWIDAPEVPEKARISYFDDQVWIDMSKEQVFTHVLVKATMVLEVVSESSSHHSSCFFRDRCARCGHISARKAIS
jgi:hypothetical protein